MNGLFHVHHDFWWQFWNVYWPYGFLIGWCLFLVVLLVWPQKRYPRRTRRGGDD